MINKADNFKGDQPCFMSDKTNWYAKEIMKLEDFIWKIDKNRPNFFEEMRERGQIREECKDESELNAEERKTIEKIKAQYRQQYYTSADDIKAVMIKSLGFRKPQLFNPELVM